ncbi:hypothetical protein ACF0H5_009799 [Mactra antiquata]
MKKYLHVLNKQEYSRRFHSLDKGTMFIFVSYVTTKPFVQCIFVEFILRFSTSARIVGFLCSEKKMTWKDAINSCFSQNGRPVTITLKNKAIIQHMLGNRISIWTSEYSSSFCNNRQEINRCGYRYEFVNATHWLYSEEVRYGSCNTDRKFVCEYGGNYYIVYKTSYDVFLKHKCQLDVSYKDEFTSDFYWVPDSKKTICSYKVSKHISGIHHNAICGACDNIECSFYVSCATSRHMLCAFDNMNNSYNDYKPCPTDQSQSSTKSSITIYTDPLKTSNKPSTSLTTSTTVKTLAPTSRQDVTHTDHVNDETQVPTTEAINNVTLKPNHSNEEQTSAKYKLRSNDQGTFDLGLYIGAPVAVLVTILVVIVIIMIVRYRRRRAFNNVINGSNQYENERQSGQDSSRLPPRNIQSINNRAYDSTLYSNKEDDEYTYIDAEGGKSNNDLKSKSFQSNISNNENDDTSDHEYSCSMDISMHDRTDCDHYNTTVGQTCPPSISTNDYDVMDRTANEDVYDTTRPMKPVHKTTDNIYNKLDQYGDIENVYDETSQQQKRPNVNDDTYNTLD